MPDKEVSAINLEADTDPVWTIETTIGEAAAMTEDEFIKWAKGEREKFLASLVTEKNRP